MVYLTILKIKNLVENADRTIKIIDGKVTRTGPRAILFNEITKNENEVWTFVKFGNNKQLLLENNIDIVKFPSGKYGFQQIE